jgi:hypothetical protein
MNTEGHKCGWERRDWTDPARKRMNHSLLLGVLSCLLDVGELLVLAEDEIDVTAMEKPSTRAQTILSTTQ